MIEQQELRSFRACFKVMKSIGLFESTSSATRLKRIWCAGVLKASGRNLIWQRSRTPRGERKSEQRTPFSPSSEKGSDRPSARAVDFDCWRGDESKRSIFICQRNGMITV